MSELPRGGAVTDDPFLVLGLPARADLTDEDVRAAWRRIAAATHPDREDGGDPARYGAAAAAYAMLRTAFGRGEALADRAASPLTRPRAGLARHSRRSPGHGGAARPLAWLARYFGNIWQVAAGRGLALHLAGTATVAALAVAVAGWTPATIGLLAGAATWLLARLPTGWGRWRWGGRGR
jgi:hypothetical protein